MLGLLQTIIDDIVCWIETGAVDFANLLISGVASLIAAMVSALPAMPDLPDVPSEISNVVSDVQYWFPIDYFLTLMGTLLTLILAVLVIKIPLRWAKAISGNE